jgi:histidinol phosphatase-like PHP family hydrolase
MALSNQQLAELLVAEGERSQGHRARAMLRASRMAYLWPEEAAAVLLSGRSLEILPGVGPSISRLVQGWLDDGASPEPAPPARSGFLTLAEARATLHDHQDWLSSVLGDLQMHTTWSDGATDIDEMADAARERGYQYIAITDHSKGLAIAHGMDEERLERQVVEIELLNERLAESGSTLRVLRGMEMNLDRTGSGDMDPAALRSLDIVLGSFHAELRRREDETERYLAAMANAEICILAHPRGRMYNTRPGLTADWPRVFAAAHARGLALEINCFPDRQDLDVERLTIAAAEGGLLSLGTDSHHPSQLAFIEFGCAAAIRAGVGAQQIVNFWPRERLVEWSRAVRH